MKSRAGLPWLLLSAIIGLSVYEFSNTGKVRWIEDGFRKIADAVDDLPAAEQTLSSSLSDAKDTLKTAFDTAEQATVEVLQPLSADLEASPIPTDAKQHRLKRIVYGDTVELDDDTRVRLPRVLAC